MKQPLVSVIIPNFNHASFLVERINSVLEQTYQDFELILLDDHSSDNSIEILNAFKNSPKVSHLIVNNENSGSTFKQWHKGILLAKGEYIWVAESDDRNDRTFLETAISKLLNDPKIGLFYCRSRIIDTSGNESDYNRNYFLPSKIDNHEFRESFSMNGVDFIQKNLLKNNCIPNASAVVFKKELYIQSTRQPINMKLIGDWLIWIRICKRTHIYFESTVLNDFRTHVNTVRNNSDKTFETLIDYFNLAQEIVEIAPKRKEELSDHLIYQFKRRSSNQNWSFSKKIKVWKFLFRFHPKSIFCLFKLTLRNGWNSISFRDHR
jgi:glycosyltransferase involved in cell wall biosynthesis